MLTRFAEGLTAFAKVPKQEVAQMSCKELILKISGYLFKLEKPSSPQQRKATIWVGLACLTVVFLLYAPIYVPRVSNYIMIQGRSMWPTIKWMTKWPFVSGYVHIQRKTPKRGDMIVFRINGKWWKEQCKRVDKIRGNYPDLELWLTADNAGVTGEGSDLSNQYHWVPLKDVVGVVDRVWNPEWNARSKTEDGRLENQLALTVDPDWLIYHEGRNFAVYAGGVTTRINDTDHQVIPAGGEKGDPILVTSDFAHAYRIKAGALVEVKLGMEPVSIWGNPKLKSDVARLNGWVLSSQSLPIYDAPLAAVADGNDQTGWFVPAGLPVTFTVDFGRPLSRRVVVKHQGHAMGDMQFESSVEGRVWTRLNPGLRGLKPGKDAIARQLGIITGRYLRIWNIGGSAWCVFEVTAS